MLDAADAWLSRRREASEHDEAVDATRGAAEQELASVESALDALPGAEVEQAAAAAEAAVAQGEEGIVMLRSRLAAEAVRQRVAGIEEELSQGRPSQLDAHGGGGQRQNPRAADGHRVGPERAAGGPPPGSGRRGPGHRGSRAAELRTLGAELDDRHPGGQAGGQARPGPVEGPPG